MLRLPNSTWPVSYRQLDNLHLLLSLSLFHTSRHICAHTHPTPEPINIICMGFRSWQPLPIIHSMVIPLLSAYHNFIYCSSFPPTSPFPRHCHFEPELLRCSSWIFFFLLNYFLSPHHTQCNFCKTQICLGHSLAYFPLVATPYIQNNVRFLEMFSYQLFH
jgi:hypothetical protein